MQPNSTRKPAIYYPVWTDSEKEILRANLKRVSYKKLVELLPGRTIDAIKRRADLMGLARLRSRPPRRALNEEFFAEPSLISAYWAGFIAADGCIVTSPRREVRIGVHEKDTDLLRRFAADSGYDGNLSFRNRMAYLTICAASRWIADLQEHYNIGPRKTHTLEPPEITGEMALAYSIGYIDGDGCWAVQDRKRGNKMLVVVGTLPLLEWLQRVWVDAGASVGAVRCRFTRNIWRLSICGSHAESIARLLDPLPIPKLERKWRVARGEAFGQERSTLER